MADPLTIYDFVGRPRVIGPTWEDNVYSLLTPIEITQEEDIRAEERSADLEHPEGTAAIYKKTLLSVNLDNTWHKQMYSRADTNYAYSNMFLAPAKIENNTFTLALTDKNTPTSGNSIYIRPSLEEKSYSKMLLSCQNPKGDGKMDLKAYIKLQEDTINMIETVKNSIYKNIVRILNIIYKDNPNIDSILQSVAEKLYKTTKRTVLTLKAVKPHKIDNLKAAKLIKHICVFPNNKTEEFILPKFESYLKLSQMDRDSISAFYV